VVTREEAISKVQAVILEKLGHFAGVFIVVAGVPREQIVLAFHPPMCDPHTGYAIACI
jgi:hypothetical protein